MIHILQHILLTVSLVISINFLSFILAYCLSKNWKAYPKLTRRDFGLGLGWGLLMLGMTIASYIYNSIKFTINTDGLFDFIDNKFDRTLRSKKELDNNIKSFIKGLNK